MQSIYFDHLDHMTCFAGTLGFPTVTNGLTSPNLDFVSALTLKVQFWCCCRPGGVAAINVLGGMPALKQQLLPYLPTFSICMLYAHQKLAFCLAGQPWAVTLAVHQHAQHCGGSQLQLLQSNH